MPDLSRPRADLLRDVMALPALGPEFEPYRRARRAYTARFKAALTACIDAGLPLVTLAGKCAFQLEMLSGVKLDAAPAPPRHPKQGRLW